MHRFYLVHVSFQLNFAFHYFFFFQYEGQLVVFLRFSGCADLFLTLGLGL